MVEDKKELTKGLLGGFGGYKNLTLRLVTSNDNNFR